MARFERKRLWIDSRVQGSLIRHVVGYWVACVLTVELLNLTWEIATAPTQPGFFAYLLQYDVASAAGRLAVSGLLLLPILADMLRLSNRFAGPVFRMQRVLRKIADGGPVERISLRSEDYWHDFADALNAALARLSDGSGQRLETQHDQPLAEPISSRG